METKADPFDWPKQLTLDPDIVNDGQGGGVLFPHVRNIINEKNSVFMYFIFSE
jgi:hypothetical protein